MVPELELQLILIPFAADDVLICCIPWFALSLSLSPIALTPTPGFVTFISFILFGLIPLIGYVIFSSTGMNDFQLFIVAIVLTAITLFFLGAVKVCLFACLASCLGG